MRMPRVPGSERQTLGPELERRSLHVIACASAASTSQLVHQRLPVGPSMRGLPLRFELRCHASVGHRHHHRCSLPSEIAALRCFGRTLPRREALEQHAVSIDGVPRLAGLLPAVPDVGTPRQTLRSVRASLLRLAIAWTRLLALRRCRGGGEPGVHFGGRGRSLRRAVRMAVLMVQRVHRAASVSIRGDIEHTSFVLIMVLLHEVLRNHRVPWTCSSRSTDLHRWRGNVSEVLEDLCLGVVQLLRRVEVLHVAWGDVEVVVRPEVLVIVVQRKFIAQLDSSHQCRLVGPAPRHIADCVSPPSDEDDRDSE
mmetsp:Transcript_38492/g.78916  ORF Transcript_38492/g.78916 Transcript_38492/m.78916 type:complete len:310 (-) Transcript_38492:898-1827(-)